MIYCTASAQKCISYVLYSPNQYIKKETIVSDRFCFKPLCALLHYYHRLGKKTVVDGTRYGTYSTRDFMSHHATAISMAIVTGAATAIVDGISKLETRAASTASPARHS